MAKKLGILNQYLFGEWADRAAINRNAEDLSIVEADVTELRKLVQQQAHDILRLRAMFMGVVEVLHTKAPFDDAELEAAVQAAWMSLTEPPPKQPAPAAKPSTPPRQPAASPAASTAHWRSRQRRTTWPRRAPLAPSPCPTTAFAGGFNRSMQHTMTA